MNTETTVHCDPSRYANRPEIARFTDEIIRLREGGAAYHVIASELEKTYQVSVSWGTVRRLLIGLGYGDVIPRAPMLPRAPRSKLVPYGDEIDALLAQQVPVREIARRMSGKPGIEHGITVSALRLFLRKRSSFLGATVIGSPE